jgi:Malate/lactate dehydrogenases
MVKDLKVANCAVSHRDQQNVNTKWIYFKKGMEYRIIELYSCAGLLQSVQKRGATVIAARKMSSAVSAAKAAGDHMHDIWHGTPPGQFVSMGVISDGSYGAPNDVIFSFPVTIENKEWKIVQVSDFCIVCPYYILHHKTYMLGKVMC